MPWAPPFPKECPETNRLMLGDWYDLALLKGKSSFSPTLSITPPFSAAHSHTFPSPPSPVAGKRNADPESLLFPGPHLE